jgi:diguanylate cyclase (GGDEF)-like protein
MSTRTGRLNFRGEAFQRWGLVFVVGAMLVTLWALIVGVSAHRKQLMMEEGARELMQMNRAVAAQVDAMFTSAATDLRVLERWMDAHPRIDPRSDERFSALADELRRSSDGLVDLRLVSDDGALFAIPAAGGKPLRAADPSYAGIPAGQRPKGLHIGLPQQDGPNGGWVIPVYWPLESAVSGIALVTAYIRLDRLSALHERLRIKPAGTITLLRSEGHILSRSPYQQSFLGRDVSAAEHFKDEFGAKESGTFVSDGAPTDGVARLVSYERLQSYPVTVLVTRGIEDMLGVFERRRSVVLGLAGLLTAVVLAFTIALHSSLLALQGTRREMQRLASSDGLTGVMNRRAFMEAAQLEFARARRYGRPCALLMLDLDHFKDINDTHGHAAGDAVLRESCAAWRILLRDQDMLGRVGGEEFCALLPETPREGARLVAERMRSAVSALRFKGGQGSFAATASIGLSEVLEGDEQLGQPLERADRALYLAKQRGRDRVEQAAAPNEAGRVST